MKNFTLISNQNFNPRANDLPRSLMPGTLDEIEHMREIATRSTGSDICPAVLYKGKKIPAARIGAREFSC